LARRDRQQAATSSRWTALSERHWNVSSAADTRPSRTDHVRRASAIPIDTNGQFEKARRLAVLRGFSGVGLSQASSIYIQTLRVFERFIAIKSPWVAVVVRSLSFAKMLIAFVEHGAGHRVVDRMRILCK